MPGVDFENGAQLLGFSVAKMASSNLSTSGRLSEIWQEQISRIGSADVPDRDWLRIEEIRKIIRSKGFALDTDCINSLSETEIEHIIIDLVSITFDVKIAHGIRLQDGN
jgi:hypothetical protein